MYERTAGLFLLLISLNGNWPINYHIHCDNKDNLNTVSRCAVTTKFYFIPINHYSLARIHSAGIKGEPSVGRRGRTKTTYHLYLIVNEGSLFFLDIFSTNYSGVNYLVSRLNDYIASGANKDFELIRPKQLNTPIDELLTIAAFLLALALIICGSKFKTLVYKIANTYKALKKYLAKH